MLIWKKVSNLTNIEIVGAIHNQFNNNEISQSRVIEEEQKGMTIIMIWFNSFNH